jgi:hypothetical protein
MLPQKVKFDEILKGPPKSPVKTLQFFSRKHFPCLKTAQHEIRFGPKRLVNIFFS